MRELSTLFDVIGEVTRRTEPFHSEVLAWFLQESPEFRNRLVAAFIPNAIREAHQHAMLSPNPVVCSEDRFGTGERIDITISWETVIVGIEVKTVDSSSKQGQLARYWDRLSNKYPGRAVHLIYLTPFSSENLPDGVPEMQLHAIKEFEQFDTDYPQHSTHVNWTEVVELYPIEGAARDLASCMRQHRDYVKRIVCDATSMARLDRTRELVDFLGEATVTKFFSQLKNTGIEIEETDSQFIIDLGLYRDRYEAIIESVFVLAEYDQPSVRKFKPKIDMFSPPSLKDDYKTGEHGQFFRKLFEETDTRPYAWVRGKAKLGLRVAHKDHRSGVSICTLSPTDIEISKAR